MKKLASILILAFTTTAFAAGQKKEVCNDKKDAKGNIVKKADGTPVKECKIITVHKKVEGTKVPDGKK